MVRQLDRWRRQLGRRIKVARENAGYTRAQLEKKLGRPNCGVVRKYEIGEVQPSAYRVARIAEECGVHACWLLGIDGTTK